MKHRPIFVRFGICAALLSFSGFAFAQTPDADPIAAYRAYETAIAGGNMTEGAAQAHRAWQLAEAKWGNTNPNTASLAYNAAWSAALNGKASERLDAARRAVELAELGKASYLSTEANFLLAYAEFTALPPKERSKKFAALARAAKPVEQTWGDILIVDALTQAALMSAGPNEGATTIDLADRALAAMARIQADNKQYRAMAYLARGQGRLFTRHDQDEGIADFIEARVSYGPMQMPDDPNWGRLAAWEMAARAINLTNKSSVMDTGTRISRQSRRPLDLTDEQKELLYGLKGNSCEEVRRIPRVGREISYPSEAIRRNLIAGLVVRGDLNPDGTFKNLRLVGAVPEEVFGEPTLAAILTWRYEVPAGAAAECLLDKEVTVSFAFE